MFLGRAEEINRLNEYYNAEQSSLIMLYGRSSIGKTSLMREFIKNKEAFYYSAAPASSRGQAELLAACMMRGGLMNEAVYGRDYDESYEGYRKLFENTKYVSDGIKLIVIEEFQNIVKNNKEFMAVVDDLVSGRIYDGRVLVIVTSSSVSWMENSMVSAVGKHAAAISAFIKLKEIAFVDIVRMFPSYTVLDDMVVYAVTGGVPGYLAQFSDKLTLKQNIIENILGNGKMLRTAGCDYIREELRESSLYNTILSYIASGENKLNDLHLHTGFGRDKISVYLKNLIEREVVEKVFSFDYGGREFTRKGLYRIKSGYTEFWYRFVYPNESFIDILGAEEFYDRYIADNLYPFAKEAFIRVGTEFINILNSMNRLEISIARQGRWWGKNGDIDIIACDNDNRYLVGKCNWDSEEFTYEMYEELMHNAELAAIGTDYVYLFSKDTFDGKLRSFARDNAHVKLISLKEL